MVEGSYCVAKTETVESVIVQPVPRLVGFSSLALEAALEINWAIELWTFFAVSRANVEFSKCRNARKVWE